MTASSLKERLLAVKLDRPMKEVYKLSKGDIEQVNAALGAHKLIIDDKNGLTINELVSRSKAQHALEPLALIVVDYIQIIASNSARSKAEEVSLIAEKLKTLAKELNCPVLCLAQNNRNIEGRSSYIDYKSGELKYAGNARMMSDLADSAGIEKWADFVCFIQRQYLVDRTRPGEADFFVVKNRNGQTEDFKLKFAGEKTKFYHMVEEKDGWNE
jgi:replicative DNA helicase